VVGCRVKDCWGDGDGGGGAEREGTGGCITLYSVLHVINKFKWTVLVARTAQEKYI
jgi:hypothetical protein